MNVVILGTGNVATILSKKILQNGHKVLQVYGREKQKAELLAKEVHADSTELISEITNDADIYIMAVSDTAIQLLADQIKLPGKLVVHTAAAISKNVLKNISNRYGVIYPLQSLRKTSLHIPEIPAFIDGDSEKTIEEIHAFSRSVFETVQKADDEMRVKLHVAAVFVSNFTNHLYALAEYFTEEEHLQFMTLQPLITETANRLKHAKAVDMQTGPAVRSDLVTIETHLNHLGKFPFLKDVYQRLTQSIIDFHRRSESIDHS
jgi:predicted short-subunit dehydrogenase-like oxidoreductase (DUF2520 family)